MRACVGRNILDNRMLHYNLGAISQNRQEIYGITILWIMLLHGSILDKVCVPPYLEWMFVILRHGNVGVDIFLFLSGMSLYYSFVCNNSLNAFIKKRTTRILLPYVLIGGTYFACFDLLIKHSPMAFVRDFFQFSFIFGGNKLVWYIVAILFCYAIFPYLYCMFFDADGSYHKYSVKVFVCLLGLIILLTFVIRKYYPDSYDNIEIALTRLPVFVLGVYFAKPIKNKKEISVAWFVLALVIVIVSYPLFANKLITGICQRYYYCLLGVSLVLVFAEIFSLIRLRCFHAFFSWFGNISLELYLCHIFFRNIFMKSKIYTTFIFPKYLLVLVISIVAALFVHKLENALLALKRNSFKCVNP